MAAALAKLPPQCRVVFELSRYEEMSYQQIAEALKISPKTVENQMGKALRILRRELAGVLKNLYWLLVYCGMAALPSHWPSAASTRATSYCATYFAGRRGGSAGLRYLVPSRATYPDQNLL